MADHHLRSPGVWLHLGKKGGAVTTLTYAAALEVALCFGWIDGQVNRFDEETFIQRFTPRRARSGWSRINVERVGRLIAAGRMQPGGLAEVQRAQADGRWEAAYDPPSRITVPEDFQRALDDRPAAAAAFADFDKQNRYAVLYRLQRTRSAAGREKMMARFLAMLEAGEKLYP